MKNQMGVFCDQSSLINQTFCFNQYRLFSNKTNKKNSAENFSKYYKQTKNTLEKINKQYIYFCTDNNIRMFYL